MKLSALYIASLALIPSLISAAAIPDAADHKAALEKRGGEINYLANCRRINWDDDVDYPASYMAWYSNSDNSLNGQYADSLSSEYRDWSRNGGDYLIWEGQTHSIYFPGSGVTVETHIDSGADTRATGQWAGSLRRTSDWKYFNCYKDNNRQLFEKSPPVPDNSNRKILCYAKYYCV